MTESGHFDAISIPILGLLGKGHRAALSARRVTAPSGLNGPDTAQAVPPVTTTEPSIEHGRSR